VVGAATQAIISTLTIANRNANYDVFRVSAAISGAMDTSSQYIYYDVSIDGNDTFAATLGITLNSGDVIRMYSLNGSSSINLFGVEIT